MYEGAEMDYTRKLAEFCAELSYDRLPGEVVEKTKLCILDYIANVYGSLELDAVRKVVGYVRSLGEPGISSAFGCGFGTGIQSAVFLNGTTGEAIEAQDGLRFGGNHPGAAVIPAALAVAEREAASGRRVIEAIVAGYEAADRPAAAMHPHHTLAGFLPTGTCGAFGAAAAASKIMGHDADRMLNSLGNAGFVAPVSMAEHLMGGYTAKIVQAGQGASAGLTAAGLAEAGITGAPYVLEGSQLKGGFTQITTKAAPDFSKITDGLGVKFTITDIYFKPFTSCRHTHGAAQAVLAIKQKEEFGIDDIESVDVFTYAIATIAVGKKPTGAGSFVSAQFSLPYVVAACIVDGMMGPAQLGDDRISDPRIIGLANKINLKSDNELNKAYPDKTSSRVEIKLAGGRVLSEQVDIPKGDPRDPMAAADIVEKMKTFAPARDAKFIERIADAVLNLEKLENAGELTRMI